jgi:acetylornithine deacetylase/succinyl-diaminopimelate desuccinylase-like protein
MPDPYSGAIVDGDRYGDTGEVIVGRGTNGQKASLAAMIFAADAVLSSQIPLKRGLAINAGVLEECGGHLSPRYLLEHDGLVPHAVLCGEHTDLRVVNRQRGMVHLDLDVHGVGGHAAFPNGTSSALAGVARVILALEDLSASFADDPMSGRCLVSLNRLIAVPNVANVIPDTCHAVVDIRHPPTTTREAIVRVVQQSIQHAIASQPGLSHTAEIQNRTIASYTGLEETSDGCMFPFCTPTDDPSMIALTNIVREVCHEERAPELWTISSEAGYFSSVAHVPVGAFGPGEDRFTHNNIEHVRLDDVVKAAKVYAGMIVKMCA